MTVTERRLPYVASGSEEAVFAAAFERGLPVMLTGPTGCGKTTFVEEMARRFGRPLVTVTCHDDLTTADLAGRYLVFDGSVEWHDGPLTSALRDGAVCYLDEVVEARRDTLALLHSVADHRQCLFLERRRETVTATAGFMLVASYNPRSRGSFKELRPSLRQRFVTIDMGYLDPRLEAAVVRDQSGITLDEAERLVAYARALRSDAAEAVADPPSTRTLVQAAHLIAAGVPEAESVRTAVLAPLTAEPGAGAALHEFLAASGHPAPRPERTLS